jgi:hypothetical protein
MGARQELIEMVSWEDVSRRYLTAHRAISDPSAFQKLTIEGPFAPPRSTQLEDGTAASRPS